MAFADLHHLIILPYRSYKRDDLSCPTISLSPTCLLTIVGGESRGRRLVYWLASLRKYKNSPLLSGHRLSVVHTSRFICVIDRIPLSPNENCFSLLHYWNSLPGGLHLSTRWEVFPHITIVLTTRPLWAKRTNFWFRPDISSIIPKNLWRACMGCFRRNHHYFCISLLNF